MEHQTTRNNPVGLLPAVKRRQQTPPDPVIPRHVRSREPESIGRLMSPIQKIIEHPDRNRLLAEFFRRNW